MTKAEKNKEVQGDLIVVGGGVAGLTLAKLMGNIGLHVHLVEPYPPEAFSDTQASGRTVALMQASLNILKAAGLEDFCTEYGTPLNMMRLYDDSVPGQKPVISEFDAFDIGLDHFGLNIPNSLLRAKLYEDIKSSESITVHQDSLCRFNVDAHEVYAHLESGTTLRAPLIIGADGRSSVVRDGSGIQVQKRVYDQSALTFIMNHSRSHDNISTEFHRPGGPFALVPMQGNQCSVVWVEKTADADSLMRLPKDAFENALQKATNNVLGGVSLETSPKSWPLCAIKAKDLIAPRTALIAEAAHVMSPITAQGLNLSLRDVASLAEELVHAARVGSDLGSAAIIKRYARRRSLDIGTRFAGVNGLNQIVSNDLLPIKDLRRTGLKMMDRFSPLKLGAMKLGLAPAFDQGPLARGEAL